jgi:hypothetical protein
VQRAISQGEENYLHVRLYIVQAFFSLLPNSIREAIYFGVRGESLICEACDMEPLLSAQIETVSHLFAVAQNCKLTPTAAKLKKISEPNSDIEEVKFKINYLYPVVIR